MNIITKITGANIVLRVTGNTYKAQINGTAAQVAHAITLLYNYHALTEIPSWYDETFTYMELSITRKHFIRGLLALVFTWETQRNGKLDAAPRCKRAIIRAAHHLKAMIMPTFALDQLADEPVCA